MFERGRGMNYKINNDNVFLNLQIFDWTEILRIYLSMRTEIHNLQTKLIVAYLSMCTELHNLQTKLIFAYIYLCAQSYITYKPS